MSITCQECRFFRGFAHRKPSSGIILCDYRKPFLKSLLSNALLFLLLPVILSAQMPDIPEWEKLGLTSKEYKMARDNNMTDEDIGNVLSAGVSIKKHLLYPWKPLEITENEWYSYVRSGLDSVQICKAVDEEKNKPSFKESFFGFFRDLKMGVKK